MKYLIAILACLLGSVQVFNAKSTSKLGSEYVEIGGETYFFDMQNHVDWERAEWICQEYHNMTLVSLQTPEKNALFKNFLVTYPDFDQNLWSSGARLADGNLLWRSTGEEITYQDWAFGEPNLPTDSEMCIIFSGQQPSGWDDIECTDRWFAFVCEYPAAK